MVNSFVKFFDLLQVVQNILFENLKNVRPTMPVAIKLDQELILGIDNACAQINLFCAFRMIKSTTIFIGAWYRDANVGSTLVARVLGFFSIDSMNVIDFSTVGIVFDLRMP